MNADLQGILDFYGDKPISELLLCDNGYYLTDKQARAYIKYCISQGHTELKTCPEYEDIKEKLQI